MQKKKILYYIKETFFVILFMTIVANVMSLYKSQDLNHNPLPLHNFTLLDGTHYTPAQNKPVIIHFWATWCPTCKLEKSNIALLSQYFDVITIAVNSGDDATLKQYIQEHDIDFKVVNDNKGVLAARFGINGYPTTFIYDKEHKLSFAEVGYTSTFGLFSRAWWSSF